MTNEEKILEMLASIQTDMNGMKADIGELKGIFFRFGQVDTNRQIAIDRRMDKNTIFSNLSHLDVIIFIRTFEECCCCLLRR